MQKGQIVELTDCKKHNVRLQHKNVINNFINWGKLQLRQKTQFTFKRQTKSIHTGRTMEFQIETDTNSSNGDTNSTRSLISSTTPNKPHSSSKCLDLNNLSTLQRCLVIVNVIAMLILLPMTIKISSDVTTLRHDRIQQIKGTWID